MSNYHNVMEFHLKYGMPVSHYPRLLDADRQELRIKLIKEEFKEYKEAVAKGDLIEAADGLGDLLYVVYGACLEHGFDANALVEEIHRSNLTKLGDDGKPVIRDDGKVQKGPNFVKPDIKSVLSNSVDSL